MECRWVGPYGLADKHRGEAASSESVRQSECSWEGWESHRATAPACDSDESAYRCGNARQERRPGWSSPCSRSSMEGAAFVGPNQLLVVGISPPANVGKNHQCHRISVPCPGRAPRE